MNLRKFYTSKNIILIVILTSVIIVSSVYWIYTLQVAHSSFENYYRFRGCVELLGKTDTYGTCKLSSGVTIKLIQVSGKWYLDGDGPGIF